LLDCFGQLVVPMVLVISDAPEEPENFTDKGLQPYLKELLPPIEAIMATRGARTTSAVVTLETTVQQHFYRAFRQGDCTEDGEHDSTKDRRDDDTKEYSAPLGWMLASSTRAHIDAQANCAAARVRHWYEDQLRTFFGRSETVPDAN
jgi:hypothetical protein